MQHQQRVAAVTTMANVAVVATTMVIAADNDEDGSSEVVAMAGNGGGGGDRHCAGCKGRGLAVIGVDGNDEDCGEDAGGGKETWVILDCAR
jgi:hypothetical protein